MKDVPISKARTFAWILLTATGGILLLGSLSSLYIAYVASSSAGADAHVDRLREIGDDLAAAARGRRGTAAASSAAFGLLFSMVSATAFRRGERWAWWALFFSMALWGLLILFRIPFLNSSLGAYTPLGFVVALVLGLFVPFRDFFRSN